MEVFMPIDVYVYLGGLGARLEFRYPNFPLPLLSILYAPKPVTGMYIPPNTLAAWLSPCIFPYDGFFRNLLELEFYLDDFYLVVVSEI